MHQYGALLLDEALYLLQDFVKKCVAAWLRIKPAKRKGHAGWRNPLNLDGRDDTI